MNTLQFERIPDITLQSPRIKSKWEKKKNLRLQKDCSTNQTFRISSYLNSSYLAVPMRNEYDCVSFDWDLRFRFDANFRDLCHERRHRIVSEKLHELISKLSYYCTDRIGNQLQIALFDTSQAVSLICSNHCAVWRDRKSLFVVGRYDSFDIDSSTFRLSQLFRLQ